nr:endonuclease/exonuclease/phosphatase family protein [Oceaniglobus trochenteri]
MILLAALLCAGPLAGDPLRIATFNVELARAGPGLLLRDLASGTDKQGALIAGIVAHVAPDVLVLQGVDHDHDGLALAALTQLLAKAGHAMPHRFALSPNSGVPTGQDMDGNGRTGEPRDAQGHGRFSGEGGMAVVSRLPIDAARSVSFTPLLWADLPQGIPPVVDGLPFPSAQAFGVQRLSSVAHWQVAINLPDGGTLDLLTWHATPPVFDGPEDRNGRRNHDETALWLRLLDGALDVPPPAGPFVVIGDANLDPADGNGRPGALAALLADPRLQDPQPRSHGGIAAAQDDGGVNARHRGDPALDTADWNDAGAKDPGNMRVDYILPSTHWRVTDAGVFWPAPDDPLRPLLGEGGNGASRHRLVWADLVRDGL